MTGAWLAGWVALRMVLATPAAAAAALPQRWVVQGETVYFLDAENQALTVAFSKATQLLGMDVVDPAAWTGAAKDIRRGARVDGSVCARPPTQEEALTLLDERIHACSGKCKLEAARWAVECSRRWEACSLSLTHGSGKDAVRRHLLAPRATVEKWKAVGDLVEFIQQAATADWKAFGESDLSAGVFLSGTSMSGKEATGLRQRAAREDSVELNLWKTGGGASWLWELLVNREERKLSLPIKDAAACFAGRFPDAVYARARRGKDLYVESDATDKDQECVNAVVGHALALEPARTQAWAITLRRIRGDVKARSGHLVEINLRPRTAKPGTPPSALPDIGASHWLTAPHADVAACLVDFPFTGAYAEAASEKRTSLELEYTVTFSPLGVATQVELAHPTQANVTAATDACLQKALLKSVTRCSASGGRAYGTISASAVKAQ